MKNAVSRTATAFLVFCATIFLLTAPGRILFPDDEIVFQTTQSLWERGDLAIQGIGKRTGEPRGRPDGTFGWAPGRDGRRYGFFGHGLSVAALPMYGVGKLAAAHAPRVWRHAIRSDHFFMHPRSVQGDWARLAVSLTNTIITALGAWMLVLWLRALNYDERVAYVSGVAYAFGTSAWAYSGTFLSEPLSALVLLAAAWAIATYHRLLDQEAAGRDRWLWLAGGLAGLSAHVHILNLVAVVCLVGYALWPVHRRHQWAAERRAWRTALALGALGVAALAVGQWARFGNPLETGRHGYYSHFVLPSEGLVALLVSPGRSLFVYAPALLLGVAGWRKAWTRHPAATAFAVSVIATRLLFVACRSDWWGGWAIGPRFLVPVVGFGLLGVASAIAEFRTRRGWAIFLSGLGLCIVMQALLATHSIFEWMLHLYQSTPKAVGYLSRSHWEIGAAPWVGFWSLGPDMLSAGAVRLAHKGYPSLAAVFGGIGGGALGSGIWLARRLTRRPALHPEP